jgi:hypothetical protein
MVSRSYGRPIMMTKLSQMLVVLIVALVSAFLRLDVVLAATFDDMAARNFICDSQWREVKTPQPASMNRPTVRVCIERNANLGVDLFILKLNDYRFEKDVTQPDGSPFVVKQSAVEAGVAVNPYDVSNDNNGLGDGSNENIATTNVECSPGATICAFTTTLKGDFFLTPGPIKGLGSVALQVGSGKSLNEGGNRNLRRHGHLQLQTNNDNDDDIDILPQRQRDLQGFAGIIDLVLEIETTMKNSANSDEEIVPLTPLGDEDEEGSNAGDTIKKTWKSLPDYVKALIICGIIMILLFLICCCAACCFWDSHFHHYYYKDRKDDDGENDDNNVIIINNTCAGKDDSKDDSKGKTATTASHDLDDISETHSLDEDDGGWAIVEHYEDDHDLDESKSSLPSKAIAATAAASSSPRKSPSKSPRQMIIVSDENLETDPPGKSPKRRSSSKSPRKSPMKSPRKKINSSVQAGEVPLIDLDASSASVLSSPRARPPPPPKSPKRISSRTSSTKSFGTSASPIKSPRRISSRIPSTKSFATSTTSPGKSPKMTPRKTPRSTKSPRKRLSSTIDVDGLPQIQLSGSSHPPPPTPKSPKRASSAVVTAKSPRSLPPPKSPKRASSTVVNTAKSPRSKKSPMKSPRKKLSTPSSVQIDGLPNLTPPSSPTKKSSSN